MIRLHGFAISNYFNMVRVALLEKGLPFEVVDTRPSQDETFLALNPMGKVPCLETSYGPLAETNVILDYLEETSDEHPLLPGVAYPRARVRQAMRICELYIELPARRLYGGVFFGGRNTEETIEQVRPLIERGLAGLRRICQPQCSPYLMGEEFTYADIVAYYAIGVASLATRQVYGWDIRKDVPGLVDLFNRLVERESFQAVNAERDKAMQRLLQAG